MKVIGIPNHLNSSQVRRTFDALGEVFSVSFEERVFDIDEPVDAWVLPKASSEDLDHLEECKRPSYSVITDDPQIPCGFSSAVRFSKHHAIPPVLAGRQMEASEVALLKSLPQTLSKMVPLASKGEVPLWAMQETDGQHHHYVALPIPELGPDEPLSAYLNGERFLQLLPLVIFLRNLTEDPNWKWPPLQASFMLDDPNLHRPTYGFINFSEVAVHAQTHNYHVCFATIPLDTWFFHKPTARVFQNHNAQLSLLMHGNDHLAKELARPYSAERINWNLKQALSRIDTFERNSGVEVSRVMAPPHGACSGDTLGEMARLGFEAASVSSGSLHFYNRREPWTRTLGIKPWDIVNGLPVFHRFPLSETCDNSILIAAALGQPIIVMGHHHNVAEGLSLLRRIAELINSLGDVEWADMKRISRSRYAYKLDGKTLKVRMLTGRVEVLIPKEATHLLVIPPWAQESGGRIGWRHGNTLDFNIVNSHVPIPVPPGKTIEVYADGPTLPPIDSNYRENRLRSLRPWTVMRRQLTEARDRMSPILRQFSSFLGKNKSKPLKVSI